MGLPSKRSIAGAGQSQKRPNQDRLSKTVVNLALTDHAAAGLSFSELFKQHIEGLPIGRAWMPSRAWIVLDPVAWGGTERPPGGANGCHIHEYCYVMVTLTSGELTIVAPAGNSEKFATEMGGAYARPKGVEHNVFNLSDKEIRFTEIELLD